MTTIVTCKNCNKTREIKAKGASAEWYETKAPYCRKCTYIVNPSIGQRLSKASKGRPGPWLGKKLSLEHRQKLVQNHKGNTGRHLTDEAKQKISRANAAALKGNIPWNKGKPYPQMRGNRHPAWKGGVTSESRLERVRFRQILMKAIFERDEYRCQICSSKKDLQVDHIQSWAEFKELRFEPDNCRTLCAACHYKITFNRDMPTSVKTWGRNLGRRAV